MRRRSSYQGLVRPGQWASTTAGSELMVSPSFSANCRKGAARPASIGTQPSDSMVVPSMPSH